jgi:predicted MPP superfamily phosphohydrolase
MNYIVKVSRVVAGKPKNENFVVRAVSVTDAEAKVTYYFEEHFDKGSIDFEVRGVSKYKFDQALFAKDETVSEWFQVSVQSFDDKYVYLVNAATVEAAIESVELEEKEKLVSVVRKQLAKVLL